MKKMKSIAVVLPDLTVIGGQRIALNWAKQLIENGYDVDILLFNKIGEFLNEADPKRLFSFEPHIFRRIKKIRLIEGLFILLRKLRSENYDVILSITPFYNRVITFFKMLKLIKSRVVIEDHSYPPVSYKDEFRSFFWFNFYRYTECSYNSCDVFRVLTQRTYDYYIEKIKKKEKVRRFPNLLDIPVIEKMGSQKPDLLLKMATYNIVYVGRFTTQKNIGFLIDAFKDISSHLDCHLWIIGDGPEKQNLLNKVDKAELTQKVTFLSSRKNNFCLVKQGDVFPLTSLWEGLPTVLLEALILKVPVVSVNCLAGPEDILGKDSERGWLVEMNNKQGFAQAIVEALTDEKKRNEKVEKAYHFVQEEYDLHKNFQKYIDIFIEGIS